MDDASGWLFVLGDRAGIEWVLRTHMMAFADALCGRASSIREGDSAFLYLTRGALGRPTRDASRIFASTKIATRVSRNPVEVAGIEFSCSCDLQVVAQAPALERGLPFQPLVKDLKFIRRKEHWSHYVRSGLVRIPKEDVLLLQHAFHEWLAEIIERAD